MRGKKKCFWVILVAFSVGLFAACSDFDEFDSPPGNGIPEGAITVEEAKASFEEQMMRMNRVVDSKDLKGWATNFTPQWKDAEMSMRDSMVAVDVPILADYVFKAIIPLGDTLKSKKLYQEKLMQKLVVVKDLRTDAMCSYVVSIIPDKDYARAKRWKLSAMDFTNYGDHGNFSGWVCYSLPLSSTVLRVDYFHEGQLLEWAGVFGVNSKEEAHEAISKMDNLLKGFKLIRGKQIGLRSDRDGWIEVDGEWYREVDLPPVDVSPEEDEDEEDDDWLDDLFPPWWDDLFRGDDGPNEDWDGFNPGGGSGGSGGSSGGSGGGFGGYPGGGSNPVTPSSVAPKASKIFRNANMSLADWRAIEGMIEKIMNNCLGSSLYNGLDQALGSGTLAIDFHDQNYSSFNYTTGKISLDKSLASSQLYHEMWHAYQAYQETSTSYQNSFINIEIEAHYAAYLYNRSLPEYTGDWYNTNQLGRAIKDIDQYVDQKGNLKPGITRARLNGYLIQRKGVNNFKTNGPESALRLEDYSYYQMPPFNPQYGDFKNINKLAKDC